LRLLADEDVDRQIVERLRRDGHGVQYVVEMEPGVSDEVVLDVAWRDMAVLLTADKDCGELIFRQGRAACGIILVRLQGVTSKHKAHLVATALDEHLDEMYGNFSVVTPGSVRIRRTDSGES
jgi:predicted nuclease of predicted toxin-antitoxin system